MRRLLLVCSLFVLIAADWPRFRGPNGTGSVADAVPIQFKAGEGILWKVALPGSGNSSPIIAGGKLFLQTSSADGAERQLICLDAATGKTLWTKSVAGAASKTHKKNTLASSTPAVEGQSVYAIFWDGKQETLHCFSVNGDEKWQRAIGSFQSEHGPGASPVVFGGKVFVNHDQDRAAQLLAYSAEDGREVWKADRKGHRACYSSPLIRSGEDGRPELLVVSTTAVTGYDPDSGKAVWNWDWDWEGGEQLRTVGSPVMWNDLVFVHAGNGGGNSRALALKVGSKPSIVWDKKQKGGFPYVPSMIVADDRLFAVTDKGIAGCFDPKTGKEIWSRRLSGGFSSSLILAGGQIYAINEEGAVFVFPASADGNSEVKRSTIDEPVIATPAVADGKLYIRGNKHLFCIGKP